MKFKYILFIALFFTNISYSLDLHESILNSTYKFSHLKNEENSIILSLGTCVVIEENNNKILITNKHIIENASSEEIYILPPFSDVLYSCKIRNGSDRLWIANKNYDISIIKVDNKIPTSLHLSNIADYDYINRNLHLGDTIYVLGFPFGIDIPNLRNGLLFYNPNDKYKEFLINASIFPGDSGSPVYDNNKKIIGIINKCNKINVLSNNVDVPVYMDGGIIVPLFQLPDMIKLLN